MNEVPLECAVAKNRGRCPCTYEPCPRKGQCCACLRHHRAADELPACCFSAAAERSYDRSVDAFLRDRASSRRDR